jgi:hypothetical protein
VSDSLSAAIRAAVAELVDAAPLPPELGPSVSRAKPRRPRLATALVVVILLSAFSVGISVLRRDRSQTTVAASGGSSGAGMVTEPPIGTDALPDPTFVRPVAPPAGLRLIEAGSSRSTPRGSREILLAGPGNRSARLLWTAPSPCRTTTVTTVEAARGDAGPDAGVSRPQSASDAPFVGSGNTGSLHWCQGETDINLITVGFDETTTRALAATVHAVSGRPDDLTLQLPPDFIGGRPSASGLAFTLAFGPDQSPAAKPTMAVHIRAAWTTDLRLLEARSGLSPATEIDVGGHRGFIGQLPGGPRYQSLTVVFDDRTLVELVGDGLTADQLVSAASSLGPADPSSAPDVSGDSERCRRLGMCG